MAEEKTPTEARQGERGVPMVWVLGISTACAVVLAIVGYFYVLAEPAEELAQPVPSVEEPADTTAADTNAGGTAAGETAQ